MISLNLLLAFIFILGISISSAFAGPKFIVEEGEDGYTMYLQLEEFDNINSITVTGSFMKDGKESVMEVNLSALDVAFVGTNKAKIHMLSADYDLANYTVKMNDKDGNILTYPMVAIALSDYDNNMAMAQ